MSGDSISPEDMDFISQIGHLYGQITRAGAMPDTAFLPPAPHPSALRVQQEERDRDRGRGRLNFMGCTVRADQHCPPRCLYVLPQTIPLRVSAPWGSYSDWSRSTIDRVNIPPTSYIIPEFYGGVAHGVERLIHDVQQTVARHVNFEIICGLDTFARLEQELEGMRVPPAQPYRQSQEAQQYMAEQDACLLAFAKERAG